MTCGRQRPRCGAERRPQRLTARVWLQWLDRLDLDGAEGGTRAERGSRKTRRWQRGSSTRRGLARF
ncbi:leucine-rich repeat extensin-like protein 3 [Iris pallida]|uniref:Leucine-rich repeat extensin-like protein 3 n=1 Tax=Iris pallida TaxID=29817 RepID=A0AAX6DYE7_IRIPA|nr:leucine-rich repeat extensin-like protein 3 [Iris pallida]